MSRQPANQGLVWLALYAWAFSLVLGMFFLLFGALFGEDETQVLMVVGAIFVFIVTPLLALWRVLMPRSWKRSLVRRGSRRI